MSESQQMRETCGKCGGPNTGAHKTYCKICYSTYQRLYKSGKVRRYRDVLITDDNTDWQQHAACKGKCKMMFPYGELSQQSVAQFMCKDRCGVMEQCLEYAIKNNIGYGVWGGMTELERFRLTNRGGRRLGPLSSGLSELEGSFT